MLETLSVALATFFATVGPIEVAAVYAVLTSALTTCEKRAIAIRGTLISGGMLFLFALAGEKLLFLFGISLAALRTSGGVLLLLIAIEMVFARPSGATTATAEEAQEAKARTDIAVFPLATPLIAGPGAIGAAILLMSHASGNPLNQAAVLLALGIILAITLVCLLGASTVLQFLGVTGIHVISRLFGVLLTALAVQFIFDGIRQSGLIPG